MPMESWWDLGEGIGYGGSELHVSSVTCPHCLYRGNFDVEYTKDQKHPTRPKALHWLVLKCNECNMRSFVLWSGNGFGPSGIHASRVYPPSLKASAKAPDHWPSQVGNAWEQAHKSLGTESWDAAAAMAGRALQAVTRGHFKAKPATLEKEIEELGSKGILPRPMVEWAHEIRLLRNIGAHPDPVEESVSAADAKDIVKFLDYFLIYVFNLPKEIADYKARRKDK
jgi:hypothetical protein